MWTQLVAIGSLLVLGLHASAFAASKRVPLETLSNLAKNDLWEPSSCPLCASGMRLEGVSNPAR